MICALRAADRGFNKTGGLGRSSFRVMQRAHVWQRLMSGPTPVATDGLRSPLTGGGVFASSNKSETNVSHHIPFNLLCQYILRCIGFIELNYMQRGRGSHGFPFPRPRLALPALAPEALTPDRTGPEFQKAFHKHAVCISQLQPRILRLRTKGDTHERYHPCLCQGRRPADERSQKRNDLTSHEFARPLRPHATMHKKTWQEDVWKLTAGFSP